MLRVERSRLFFNIVVIVALHVLVVMRLRQSLARTMCRFYYINKNIIIVSRRLGLPPHPTGRRKQMVECWCSKKCFFYQQLVLLLFYPFILHPRDTSRYALCKARLLAHTRITTNQRTNEYSMHKRKPDMGRQKT